MFKFFRRRRPSYYSSDYFKTKQANQGISWLWFILCIPLGLLALEVLSGFVVDFAGKRKEIDIYRGEPGNVAAYRLKFVDNDLSNYGTLLAQQSFNTGYKLKANQKNEYWQINQQGFRENLPIPLAKPKNEVRIFLLGGSTAFGQWNPSDKSTISSNLAMLLQKRVAQQKTTPDKYRPDILPSDYEARLKAQTLPKKIQEVKYRTINCAVPGYASGNILAQLALEILPYQPDAIIILDGYADLMLPSDRLGVDASEITKFIGDAPAHFSAYLAKSVRDTITHSEIYKASNYWLFPSTPTPASTSLVLQDNTRSLNSYFPADKKELDARIARYTKNYRQIANLTNKADIPLVIAIQPEITSRAGKQLTDREKKILEQLGQEYTAQVKSSYPKFISATKQLPTIFPQNVKVIDFYNNNKNLPIDSFFDAVHLTEKGNQAIAKQLLNTVMSFPQLQVNYEKPDNNK